ncbi:putative mitochondrial protein AtMg00310 [Silene latifolia]|uniref:putative mitochondrial protein AtMg00310 n=1 Tax=Silene latifolia TaxID=37657 RepID=UPI003D7866D9
MSVFKLPANFCDELRSIVSRFWWGTTNGRGKIPWIAWSKLCKPKCFGGLGFRDYHHFNMALLAKQAWRFLTDRSSLMVRVLGGKYCPNEKFLRAELGNNPSFTWRGIWEAREVIRLGARRRVGDGLSTYVWTGPWIIGTQTRRVISPRRDEDMNIVVAELWRANGKEWDTSKVRRFFLPFEQERILNMRISNTKPNDVWTWDFEKDGEYSVKSAYKLLTGGGENEASSSDRTKEKALWNSIWKANVLPKID